MAAPLDWVSPGRDRRERSSKWRGKSAVERCSPPLQQRAGVAVLDAETLFGRNRRPGERQSSPGWENQIQIPSLTNADGCSGALPVMEADGQTHSVTVRMDSATNGSRPKCHFHRMGCGSVARALIRRKFARSPDESVGPFALCRAGRGLMRTAVASCLSGSFRFRLPNVRCSLPMAAILDCACGWGSSLRPAGNFGSDFGAMDCPLQRSLVVYTMLLFFSGQLRTERRCSDAPLPSPAPVLKRAASR